MLGYCPDFKLKFEWDFLKLKVQQVAENFVWSGQYKNHIYKEHGASIVSTLPEGGWISKSRDSHDFFVYGGIKETDQIGDWFKGTFPSLTFTPATMCWSSRDVPRHKDAISNGQSSFVYPLEDSPALGTVYNNDDSVFFQYPTVKYQPVVINITTEHQVEITEPRTWFSIHMHETVEEVKKVFDKYQQSL